MSEGRDRPLFVSPSEIETGRVEGSPLVYFRLAIEEAVGLLPPLQLVCRLEPSEALALAARLQALAADARSGSGPDE
jgi:hypothetical protein